MKAFVQNEESQFTVDLLSTNTVELAYAGTSRDDIFRHVANLIEANHHVPSGRVYRALCAREELSSTALGHGVAVPHGRLSGLHRPLGVFLRMAKMVAYDDEGESVQLVFALLVPENTNTLHLNVLAQLMQVLSDPKQREKLTAATDPAEVCAIFGVY